MIYIVEQWEKIPREKYDEMVELTQILLSSDQSALLLMAFLWHWVSILYYGVIAGIMIVLPRADKSFLATRIVAYHGAISPRF